MAVRAFNQQQLAYCPHTSVDGEVWQFVQYGTATSNGAAGGTTVIDASADSGGADTYNGRYWVHITSGTAQGEWKRVVDDDGSGTLTLENNGFSAQIDSGDEYELWKSPEPVVLVDSSSGETNMVDAVRADGDDFWIGYYACPITGSHRGKIAEITDFVSGTGTFTLAASFGGALAAGDVVLIRRFVDSATPSDGLTEEYIARPQNRIGFSKSDGAVTVRGGTFGFETEIVGTNSLTAAGSVAGGSVLDGLFQAAGLEVVKPTSSTIAAGSTTTAINVDAGQWENHPIGSAVIHNGNLRWVTGLTDGTPDVITVTPALPVAPEASDVLYGVRSYKMSTDGDSLGCVVEFELDGIRHTVTGCKGTVSITDAAKPMLAWEFSVDHFVREIEPSPYQAGPAYSTSQPVVAHEREAWISATKIDIGGFTASPNTEVAGRMVQGASGINGRSAYQIINFAPGATFRELLDSSGELDQQLRWSSRTAKDLIVTYGDQGNAVSVRIPVARYIEQPKPEDQDGMVGTPSVVGAHDAGTAADGGSTVQKVPDFAIALS